MAKKKTGLRLVGGIIITIVVVLLLLVFVLPMFMTPAGVEQCESNKVYLDKESCICPYPNWVEDVNGWICAPDCVSAEAYVNKYDCFCPEGIGWQGEAGNWQCALIECEIDKVYMEQAIVDQYNLDQSWSRDNCYCAVDSDWVEETVGWLCIPKDYLRPTCDSDRKFSVLECNCEPPRIWEQNDGGTWNCIEG